MTTVSPLIRRAREHGNPVIQGNRATFVLEGEDQPYLIGDPTGWEERPKPFKRLNSKAPAWSCSLTLPPDAYVEYVFYFPDADERFLDPLNPRSVNNGVGSRNNFFYMPGAEISPFSVRRAGVPSGTLSRHRVDTGMMQDDGEREIFLYTPPARGPFPLLVVYDGPDYMQRARLITIVENLVANKRMRPVALAFLQNGRSRRHLEYICSDATISWLDKEVLPLARQHIRLINLRDNPSAHGVLGASAGESCLCIRACACRKSLARCSASRACSRSKAVTWPW
jgi:enterochelin esterase family protein